MSKSIVSAEPLKASNVLDEYLQDIGELTDHQYHWIKIVMEDFAKRYASQFKESQPTVGKSINWKELRDSFFFECTDVISVCDGRVKDRKVNMTPHNLFEWFKSNIEQQQPTEVERMKWVKAKVDAEIKATESLGRYKHTMHSQARIQTLKSVLLWLDQPFPSLDSTPNTQEAKAFHCLNEEDNGKKHRCKTQCSACPELYGENSTTQADETKGNL
jgi:hypothetical protein